MLKGKLRFLIAAGVILCAAAYYALLFFLSNPEQIEKELKVTLENLSGGTVNAQEFKLSYFPTLSSEFRNTEISIQDPVRAVLKAEKLKFRFGFFGFLLGRADLSSIELKNTSIQTVMPSQAPFRYLDVTGLELRARLLRSFKKVQLQWQGDFEGVEKSFSGKAVIGIPDPAERDWLQMEADGDLHLSGLPLTLLKGMPFEKHLQIQQGTFQGKYHLKKTADDPWMTIQGHAQIQGLIYEAQTENGREKSPAIHSGFELEAGWQPLEEQLAIEKALFTMPFGSLQMSGRVMTANREVKDFRLAFSDLILEQIPQYYLPFRDAVPFNFGFSGKSALEMSIEGALDHLTFHGNWDLSPSFLSYGNSFSKPKDIPCNLMFDFLLKNNKTLGGDFSLKLNDAGFKGTLANFDLRKGEGDLNLLSNKFQLERWAPLLPAFEGYTVGGDIKVLANFSGNLFDRPQEVKSMINVILEKGSVSRGSQSLTGIYLALDYSPISMEVKQGQILAGRYPLFFNVTVFDPKTQLHAKASIHSERADIAKLLRSMETVGEKILPEKSKKVIRQIRPLVDAVLPEGQTASDFRADIEMKGQKTTVSELKGNAYGGTFSGTAIIDPENKEKMYEGAFEVNQVSLAKFFDRNPKAPKLMNGNLFLRGGFEGNSADPKTWQEGFLSQGVISITNGEFNTFSMFKTISGITGLSQLAQEVRETTAFDDFQAGFKVENGKLVTEKVSLISGEIKAEGDGEVSLEGLLNYRINAYLSTAAVRGVLGDSLGADGVNDYLGPIPMLLSGEWEAPELKTDPSSIAEFAENLAKKKTQKVLRNFLPEDVLFSRPSKS